MKKFPTEILARANIILFEDDETERAHAAAALGREVVYGYRTTEQYKTRSGLWASPLDEEEMFSADGVLTDLMMGEEPQGLGVALWCKPKGIPCVMVTSAGHAPRRWIDAARNALPSLGVPVVCGGPPKLWAEAFEKLCGLMWARWLTQDTDLGAAARRYQKFVVDTQPAVS